LQDTDCRLNLFNCRFWAAKSHSAYIARNAGLLVWDMLYGIDAKLQPRRQMAESEEVSSDGRPRRPLHCRTAKLTGGSKRSPI
jgi:hypothetical protein